MSLNYLSQNWGQVQSRPCLGIAPSFRERLQTQEILVVSLRWRGELIAESTKQSNKTAAQDQERTHRLRLSNGKLGIIRERKQTPTLIEYLESSVMPWAASQFATKPKNLKWYKDNQQVLTAYEPLTNARLGDIGKELAGRI